MHLTALLLVTLASTALGAPNEPCYGPNGVAGVCIDSTTCSNGGGTSISGACPADASNIRCCSKTSCSGGNCRWNSDCGGSSVTGQCPGPAAFRCCQSSDRGFGGYAAPRIPAVGSCKQNAVSGARAVVNAFPGRVREIFCIRDCACGSGSDHCCGEAIDFMCSDAGGAATMSGREIAEWVMNNRASLRLKYVIWGQRIWSPGRDAVGPWTGWRSQGDRGSITANHWDHVHVSFN